MLASHVGAGAHELLDLGRREAIAVTRDRVLERARSATEVDRALGIPTGKQAVQHAAGEGVAASHAVDDRLDMMHGRVRKLAVAHHEVTGQIVRTARMHHAARRVHRLETWRGGEDLLVRGSERFLRPVRAFKLQHALDIAA